MIRTLASLANQLARWIPYPEHPPRRHVAARSTAGRDSCGLCPACREFIAVDLDPSGEPVSCPRCGDSIRSLDPPGTS